MSLPDIPKAYYLNQDHLEAIDAAIEEIDALTERLSGPDQEEDLMYYDITCVRLRELRAFARSRLGTMLVDIDTDKGDPWATPTT